MAHIKIIINNSMSKDNIFVLIKYGLISIYLISPFFICDVQCAFYFGAVLYKYVPISANTTFGSQTAANADIIPFTAKVVDIVINKM